MNETEIIKKIIAGDHNAYEQLVTRYHVGLIIHCDRLLNDRDAAEDIAQEAFIKAFTGLDQFNPERARFSTWLYKIATNKALDYLRAHKRSVTVEDIDAFTESATPDYEAEEAKRTIRSAVTNLHPPTYRYVIEAHYWHGKSYEQIATHLKIPINTVRTWLRRAKQKLRSDLS